ncbi:hypothetical protein KVR01_009459 [Diaporthe batatas]|uniref:uncharacterized protein n=1 Tax=Diaporthe batatas TaxID=748121 RepID=UPI001D03C4B9|nr:uncharacterized protein KVR01_009459 [Diaporthe batatas]KAG8161195.1 hypothetical protein KVR01_009459 [Diaporthe batatas]
MTDADVLRHLADWLAFTYSQGIRLHGILYLHRITDVRMQGSARKNLIMFNKLCGENALHKVVLVTTMWENLKKEDQGVAREAELRNTNDFWGWMSARGSKIERHTNDSESAKRLIEMFLPFGKQKAPEHMVLRIQEEMADENKLLEDTKAGEAVRASIKKEGLRLSQALREYQQSAREAMLERDNTRQQEMEEIMADMKQQEGDLLRNREVLSAEMEEMVRARYDQAVDELEDEKIRRLSIQYSIRGEVSLDIGTLQSVRSESPAAPNGLTSHALITSHSTFKSSRGLSLSLSGRHCAFIGPAYTKSLDKR